VLSIVLELRLGLNFSIRLVLLLLHFRTFIFLQLISFLYQTNIVCLDDVCRVKLEGVVN